MHVVTADQQDPRLGRHVVHDPRSRAYEHTPRGTAYAGTDRPWSWHIYQPHPIPRQDIGCCTGVDQAVKANAAGNRIPGRVLDMQDAIRFYALATHLDDAISPGSYPPTDTGSSALAACKAAQQLGTIDRYEWIFGGVDAIIEALRFRPVGVGTWWYRQMFTPVGRYAQVIPGGDKVGGHQWTLTGYDPYRQLVKGLCWWGPTFGINGRFTIARSDLTDLLADDGDAHVTYRAGLPHD